MPSCFASKVLSLTHSCAATTELMQQDNVTVSEPLQHLKVLVTLSELVCDFSELLCVLDELSHNPKSLAGAARLSQK